MLKINKKPDLRQTKNDNLRSTSIKNQQYYQSINTQDSKTQKEPSKLKKAGLAIAIIGVGILFIYNSFLSSNSLRVSSEIFRPKAEYQASIDNQLSKLINKNKLTIDTQAIEAEIKKQYPEVSSVAIISPTVGAEVEVDVTVIEPKLILKSGNDFFVIDERGRAVAKNTTNPTTNIPAVNDQTSYKIELGKQVLTVQQVQFMSYIASQAKQKGINIKELVLPSGSAGELFVYLTDKNHYIKFIMDDTSADIQLGTYLALIAELSQQGKQPSEYVDVRVEGKAFVK